MRLIIAILIAAMVIMSVVLGPASAQVMDDYCSIPPFISAKGPPLVMLVVSREHKLFMEAYTDYNDIDEDPQKLIDTTYDDTITYYGYFDPYKDYNHDGSKFVPVGATVTGTHKRSSGEWSGNFLNWATMSRIDTIRKVLYGGYRSTDSDTETVLERASIPTDAHSWVKVYPGDPSDFAPYSETITLGNTTLTSGGPPLLRVATGDESSGTDGWPRWAANEQWQCVDRGKGGSTVDTKIPPTADIDDYIVRVQVAVDGNLGSEKVKQYPDGNYKPIGLLQAYGEDDTIYFGLITGSYRNNKSGGVLRRNITSFSSEVNADDGTFTAVSGIVKNLNEIKIADYDYVNGNYGSNCSWGLYSFSDDQCRSWGNPIGEMYYEALRYYAGEDATSEYAADDSSYGLTTETWTDPYDVYPWCSQPNILVITDENPSFDSDEYPDASDIGITSVTDLTNAIDEVSSSTDYFIGNNGSTNNNQCTAKSISGLGAVYGLCQEEPRREGSYHIAGLAHYAKTHDMHGNDDDDEGTQKITTYSVVLNTKLPEILIPVGDTTVKLIPACRTYSTDTPLHRIINGALVDFRVISQDDTSGKFYVNWENSEQGSDFDQDCDGYLTYAVSGSQITVTAQITSHSAGRRFDFGYILSGTTDDGLHLPVNSCNDCDYQYNASWPYTFFSDADSDQDTNPMETTYQPLAPTDCGDISTYKAAWQFLFSSDTYTAGSTAAQLLKDPLWYAAKWGGFKNIDGDDIPDDDPPEWSRDGDATPDTYFYVQNPSKLEGQLNKAIGEILRRTSSGTAVSVLSTSAGGEGALFQAYFNPTIYQFDPSVGDVNEVNWVGYLNALWVDQYGNLREDNGDQRLVLSEDYIIQFDLNDESDTVVKKYEDSNGDGQVDDPNNPIGTYPLSDLQPIWEGGANLASSSAGDRTIYTYVDKNNDGIVADTEFSDTLFVSGEAATLASYLNAVDSAEAGKIIQFIRGEHIDEEDYHFRYRGPSTNVWKLGDIVYSTPTIAGRPMENYHLVYGDTSYLGFMKKHKARETVIYAGANDGMLHAFSAGTYHEGDDTDTVGVTEQGWYSGDCGKELWAYIPYNLLPQLKWLTDPGYCHVYYVDLKVKVVDAKIFTPDTDYHINGWGTVLVGAMRLGGKPITLSNVDFDTGTASHTFRSAYFAIDITNPLVPDLLWEYTEENGNLNFTTSYPAVFRVGTVKPFDSNNGDWYVMFGSGPTTFEGDGATTGYVYIHNLSSGLLAKTFTIDDEVDNNPVFMASPITIDLDLDYQVDLAYIGTSYYDSTDARWEGKIFRIDINESTSSGDWDLSPFISFDQPITVAPIAALDPFNRLWLFWGTGRFFTGDDKTDTTTQRLYGVWDPRTGTVDPSSELNDVTDIEVYEWGYMDTDETAGQDTTFPVYLAQKRVDYNDATSYGWYLDMTSPLAIDGERVINTPTVLGDIVLFPTFKPEDNICAFGGDSYLFALYYETGTAYKESVIGLGSNFIDVGGDKFEILKRKYLGAGMPTNVVVHAGREEGVKGMVQLGTGVVEVVDIDPAASPQSKTIFWREKAD